MGVSPLRVKTLFPKYYHIGCLKTGSTSIQNTLERDQRINVIRRSHINTMKWYLKEKIFFCINNNKVNIVSNENILWDSDGLCGFITSISRIKKVNPNAHLIITIREQRDLLISAFKHEITHSNEYYKDFESFICSPTGIRYLNIVDYYNIFKVMSCFFLKDKIHFLLLEDLRRNDREFFRKLYRIIGLSLPNNFKQIKSNIGLSENYIKFCNFLNKLLLFRSDSILSKIQIFQHRLLKKINRGIFKCYNNSKINYWKNSTLLDKIEKEIEISNQNLMKEYDIDLNSYGYLC